jgi:ferric-dicitrate binding protein FerR (iron transport regulator)
VVTPTAVASVKGTKWWTVVESARETRVMVLEGDVQVQHRATEEVVLVSSGHTGISSSEGTLAVIKTDETMIPEESGELERGDIEIEFEDASGEKKTIHIEYEK